MDTQDGENDFHRFSFISEPRHLKQLQCWTCFTNEEVHETLRKGLADSPFQRTNPEHRTALLSEYRNQNRDLPR